MKSTDAAVKVPPQVSPEYAAKRGDRDPWAFAGLWLRGAAMGIAELVPGVSGGTIAFITGIYQELLATIRSYDHRLLALLLRRQWRAVWEQGNVGFVLVLLFGMASSLVSLAAVVQWLFVAHEILIWSFFFGLITASVVFVGHAVTPWTSTRWLLATLGLVLGMTFSQLGGLPPTDGGWLTLASGALAICAWMLPGVSGSFVLLILGQYQRVIRAISELDLTFLAIFGAGCVLGLLLFSRLLTWLLRHFYGATLALLCGVMAGSLQRLWPWQQIQSYYLDSDGGAIVLRGRPLLPWQFEDYYGDDALLFGAILAALAGMAVVLLLDLASRSSRQA
ncbi:MAG: DUF368 domain-containing protein [Gammaproteobacteria bacterium]|nr:DUF368 domain-containing protein [Gammaproteobacteria bacterium]